MQSPHTLTASPFKSLASPCTATLELILITFEGGDQRTSLHRTAFVLPP